MWPVRAFEIPFAHAGVKIMKSLCKITFESAEGAMNRTNYEGKYKR